MPSARPEKPVEDDEQQTSEVVKQGASNGGYVAPFHPYYGVPLSPNRYAVTLNPGHTLAKHWEAISEDLGEGGWYSATLSDEQRERIRRDPGVKLVSQYGRAEWGGIWVEHAE